MGMYARQTHAFASLFPRMQLAILPKVTYTGQPFLPPEWVVKFVISEEMPNGSVVEPMG